MTSDIHTGCPFCGTGCALSVECGPSGYKVKGDKANPSTQGDLCFKPIQMAKELDTNRLDTPLYRERRTDAFRPVSWEKALDILAEQIELLPREALYFYLSGQLLSEESYLFTKFIKGYLGTNNVDANSRLCMASTVVAHKMAFGSDGPLGSYNDIDDADVILISGSNPAWAHPVVFRRILARKKKAPDTLIVTIDPVRTATAEKSDLWIGLRGGSDTMLYNAILSELYRRGQCDTDFINNHCESYGIAIEEALRIPFADAIRDCDLSSETVEKVIETFASDKKIVGLWCQGLNQADNGVMRNLGFINLFLATGRVNATRGLPLSLTGQPNAMGGRECGYLSNALPGYRDVRNDEDRRSCESHWDIPSGSISSEPGMHITDAIDSILGGQTRLLWVACTNPLLTLPDTGKTALALNDPNLFLIVQDCSMSETAALANLILPSASWGEKEGSMTNSERFIKRVRSFKKAPAGVKSDADIVCDIANKLGFSGFGYDSIAEIYNEYKNLTRDRLCDQSMQEYDTLSYQWGGERLYSDAVFATLSGKARFHPVISSAPRIPDGWFTLITGRTKKQWHTMTRTGHVKELLEGEEEAYVLIHPDDAHSLGYAEGEIVRIENDLGSLSLPLRIGEIVRGHLFAPFGYARHPINSLVPVRNDPLSGQSALKSAQVRLIRNP